MRDCWQAEAGLRPSFSELAEKISSVLAEGSSGYLPLSEVCPPGPATLTLPRCSPPRILPSFTSPTYSPTQPPPPFSRNFRPCEAVEPVVRSLQRPGTVPRDSYGDYRPLHRLT